MKFKYKAYDASTRAFSGTLDAENYGEAWAALKVQGLTVTNLEPEKVGGLKILSENFLRLKLGGDFFVAIFFKELSVLLNVMTLHESLQVMENSASSKTSSKILQDLLQEVEEGSTFCDALRKHEIIFGSDAISAVETGETGGKLQEISESLARELMHAHEVSKKVRGALMYPVVVIFAAICAAGVLINVTLPVFGAFYGEVGGELPLLTQIFLTGGNFVAENWIFLILASILIFVLLAIVYQKISAIKFWSDRLLLKINLLKSAETRSLFIRLSILIESGMMPDAALKFAAKSRNNSFLKAGLLKIADGVSHGKNLSSELERNLPVKKIYVGMLKAGEIGGEQPQMLRECAKLADSEIEEILQTLPAKAEIFGVLIAGLLVMFLVMAVMLPILNVTNLS